MTKGKCLWLLLLVPFFSQPCLDTAEACPLCEMGKMVTHKRQSINVIGKKAGHVLIRIKEDKLHAYFLGGGHDINRLVQIKVEEIPLTVSVPGKGEMALILKASPMKLADEEMGHCSHFVAKADWLKDVEKFYARGEVVFKGIRQELVINTNLLSKRH
jgi:hypothetical protein